MKVKEFPLVKVTMGEVKVLVLETEKFITLTKEIKAEILEAFVTEIKIVEGTLVLVIKKELTAEEAEHEIHAEFVVAMTATYI